MGQSQETEYFHCRAVLSVRKFVRARTGTTSVEEKYIYFLFFLFLFSCFETYVCRWDSRRMRRKTTEPGPLERVFDVRRSFPRFPCVKICPKIYVYSHILSSSLNIVHVFVPTANRQFIAFLYHTTRVHAFFYIFFFTTNRQPRIASFVRSFVHRRKIILKSRGPPTITSKFE